MNEETWIAIAIYPSWMDKVPPGYCLAIATKGGDYAITSHRRRFLVPEHDIRNGPTPFVVDVTQYKEVF